MSLKVKNIAPNFKLLNQNDVIVDLKLIKNNLVLFFYPKDNTPGCTKEVISFSKYLTSFNNLGYTVLGVSKDSTEKHRKFIKKHTLLVDLLSDFENNISEKYGVWVEKNMYGKKYFGIERTTFIINKSKKIENVWNKVKVNNHVEEVLDYINNCIN